MTCEMAVPYHQVECSFQIVYEPGDDLGKPAEWADNYDTLEW